MSIAAHKSKAQAFNDGLDRAISVVAGALAVANSIATGRGNSYELRVSAINEALVYEKLITSINTQKLKVPEAEAIDAGVLPHE